MTRRAIVALALLASCALTMGAGWLSGPRFGVGIGSGFAPMAARVPAQVQTLRAEDIPDCVLALYPDGYATNTGGIANLTDYSGTGNHLTQATENKKPTYEAYLGVPSLRFKDTGLYMSKSTFTGASHNTQTSFVISIANRLGIYTTTKQGFGYGDIGSVKKYCGVSYFGARYSNSKDIFGVELGSNNNAPFSATDLFVQNCDWRIFGYVCSGTSSLYSSVPGASFTANTATPNFGFESKAIGLGTDMYSGSPDVYAGDVNIFSVHVWNRALTQTELDTAVSRVQSALARGYR